MSKTLLKTSLAYESLKARGLVVSESALPVIGEIIDDFFGKLADQIEALDKKVTGQAVLEAWTILQRKMCEKVQSENSQEIAKKEDAIDPAMLSIVRLMRPAVLKYAKSLDEFITEQALIQLKGMRK